MFVRDYKIYDDNDMLFSFRFDSKNKVTYDMSIRKDDILVSLFTQEGGVSNYFTMHPITYILSNKDDFESQPRKIVLSDENFSTNKFKNKSALIFGYDENKSLQIIPDPNEEVYMEVGDLQKTKIF
jgi:hypothetical protein